MRKNRQVNWPVGTRVRMVDCSEADKYGDRIWTTRSEPWEVCGSQVVLLDGKSGGFATNRLEVVERCDMS
ncbi:MAG: hypothetical protein E6X17_05855 [Sporomusaceae bacterium]|nr:hypothetical protein [Sporomusaceae bacterium]